MSHANASSEPARNSAMSAASSDWIVSAPATLPMVRSACKPVSSHLTAKNAFWHPGLIPPLAKHALQPLAPTVIRPPGIHFAISSARETEYSRFFEYHAPYCLRHRMPTKVFPATTECDFGGQVSHCEDDPWDRPITV